MLSVGRVLLVLLAGVPVCRGADEAYYDADDTETAGFYDSYNDEIKNPPPMTTFMEARTRLKRNDPEEATTLNPGETIDVKEILNKILQGRKRDISMDQPARDYTDSYEYLENSRYFGPQDRTGIASEFKKWQPTVQGQQWSPAFDEKQGSVAGSSSQGTEQDWSFVPQPETSTYSKDDIIAEVRKLIPAGFVPERSSIGEQSEQPTQEVQTFGTTENTEETEQTIDIYPQETTIYSNSFMKAAVNKFVENWSPETKVIDLYAQETSTYSNAEMQAEVKKLLPHWSPIISKQESTFNDAAMRAEVRSLVQHWSPSSEGGSPSHATLVQHWNPAISKAPNSEESEIQQQISEMQSRLGSLGPGRSISDLTYSTSSEDVQLWNPVDIVQQRDHFHNLIPSHKEDVMEEEKRVPTSSLSGNEEVKTPAMHEEQKPAVKVQHWSRTGSAEQWQSIVAEDDDTAFDAEFSTSIMRDGDDPPYLRQIPGGGIPGGGAGGGVPGGGIPGGGAGGGVPGGGIPGGGAGGGVPGGGIPGGGAGGGVPGGGIPGGGAGGGVPGGGIPGGGAGGGVPGGGIPGGGAGGGVPGGGIPGGGAGGGVPGGGIPGGGAGGGVPGGGIPGGGAGGGVPGGGAPGGGAPGGGAPGGGAPGGGAPGGGAPGGGAPDGGAHGGGDLGGGAPGGGGSGGGAPGGNPGSGGSGGSGGNPGSGGSGGSGGNPGSGGSGGSGGNPGSGGSGGNPGSGGSGGNPGSGGSGGSGGDPNSNKATKKATKRRTTKRTTTTTTTTTQSTTTTQRMDIDAIMAIISNLTYDYEWNLTEQFNKSIIQHGVPTCPWKGSLWGPGGAWTAVENITTLEPVSFENGSVVSKCFVCGLTTPEIPRNAYCADAFAGDFLPLMPIDARSRSMIANYRKYCKYFDVQNFLENPEEPRAIYGRFTGGCAVRWTDITGVYTQRTCRSRYRPLLGKHFASKRMAKLELALVNVENGCIISPMATLLPVSRGISLYARFHACVCNSNWCNRATLKHASWDTVLTILLAHSYTRYS